MNIKKFVQSLNDREIQSLKVELGLIEKKQPVVKKDVWERRREFAENTNLINGVRQKTKKDFFNYWSELNKSKTKMRFEIQKTWDLKRRLETWVKNSEKFNKGKDEPKQSRLNALNEL